MQIIMEIKSLLNLLAKMQQKIKVSLKSIIFQVMACQVTNSNIDYIFALTEKKLLRQRM